MHCTAVLPYAMQIAFRALVGVAHPLKILVSDLYTPVLQLGIDILVDILEAWVALVGHEVFFNPVKGLRSFCKGSGCDSFQPLSWPTLAGHQAHQATCPGGLSA